MNLNYIDYLELFGALVTSIGGAAVVIIAISKWFGDLTAKTLFEKFRSEKEKELEGIKNEYNKELEKSKSNLEKARSLFFRYSEKQFELYNELWKVLLYTKNQADSLWLDVRPEKLPAFSEQIKNTKNAINDNMLLIEEKHYKKLMKLIEQFEQFQFGKQKLINVSSESFASARNDFSKEEVARVIDNNRATKDAYNSTIDRKSTRLNSSHIPLSRMPSSA